MAPAHVDSSVKPFLNAFKDGQLVESICLHGREVFVLGRHTDCNVPLAHLSISRRHAEIRLAHASREVLITDLDSVHGTFIDGQRLPPLTPFAAKEGEPIKLGVSSRTYRVQWLARSPEICTMSQEEIRSEQSKASVSKKLNVICTGTVKTSPRQLSRTENSAEIFKDIAPPRFNTASPCPARKKTSTASEKVQKGQVLTKHDPLSSLAGSSPKNVNRTLQLSQQHQLQQQQIQKGGLPPLPPQRRVPFAPIQPNTSPSPAKKKMPPPSEKKIDFENNNQENEVENIYSGTKIWLRRSNSAPITAHPHAPNLPSETRCQQPLSLRNASVQTDSPSSKSSISRKLCKGMTNDNRNVKCVEDTENGPYTVAMLKNEEEKKEDSSRCSFPDEISLEDEEYPSDKENQEPLGNMAKTFNGLIPNSVNSASCEVQFSNSTATTCVQRRPFQPLTLTSSGLYRPSSPSGSYSSAGEETSLSRDTRRHSAVVQSLDDMLQKLKGLASNEPHREWHVVVDTTSLLDPASFKCLKLLEGIREVRLIIPQIVIRELDICKSKEKGLVSPSVALKWIETCMVKFPSWIHVQNSSEILAVGTPPVSPRIFHSSSTNFGSCFPDMFSPMNSDHVLNCALLFNTTVFNGQVVLLTNDTALKIKAMAEGLACESATTFCDSLLSPYSERFLWTGSVAHRTNFSERAALSRVTSSSDERSKRTFFSGPRELIPKRFHFLEGLKSHCRQSSGLKAILNY